MSGARCLRRFVLGLVLLQTLFALGQDLVVNGQPVAGRLLVQGSSYAPADAFGAALGADTFYDAAAQTVTFDLAGRLLSVTLGNGEAALTLDGEGYASDGAVLDGGLFYVPVKPVATALGGTVTWLPSQQTVMVVLPRAKLRSAKVDAKTGYERFVLDFDGLTPFETYFNRALGTLHLRFVRADMDSARTFSGRFFKSAVVTPNAGYLDFRVTLLPGYRFESYTSPRPSGFSLVVDVLPDTAAPLDSVAAAPRPLVVIDPGHGGGDEGLRLGTTAEKDLTLRFALSLADALAAYDVDVRLTRRDDVALAPELRSQMGLGAGLFVSLHAANLAARQFNLYYLGDVLAPAGLGAGLDTPLRENAEAAVNAPDTDALRRRILLNLVPDLSLGERYARSLGTDLVAASFQADLVGPAPLTVLYGAAGRGVLLELSPEDLAAETLAEPLAAALVSVLTPKNGN